MSREVFLPCVNLNSEIGFWMTFYERWQGEVDKLSVKFGRSHGQALTELVRESESEYLLFCEMDGIIFRKGVVDKYFSLLESGEYDVIGSPRMSCGPEIARIAKQKFNLDYSGLGDRGPHFWPNFFFVKKSLLYKTDLNFSNSAWGDGSELLGEKMQQADASDTMGWMSLQLRGLTDKILEIPQYHTSPFDLDDYDKKQNIFNGNAPWIHFGSVSGDLRPPKSEMEKLEATKRLVYRKMCGRNVSKDAERFEIDEQLMQKWEKSYREILYAQY